MISFSLLSNILKPYIFMEILVLGWANLGPLIRICPYIYTNVKPLFLPILIPFNPSAYVLFDQTDPGTKGIGKNTCCQGHVWGPWDGSGTDPFPCQRLEPPPDVGLGPGGTPKPFAGHVGHNAPDKKAAEP